MVGTESEQEAERQSLQAYFVFDDSREAVGHIAVHATALPTILVRIFSLFFTNDALASFPCAHVDSARPAPPLQYHYEDTLAEESESSTKARHAPTRQAGLSELLCVVGRLLLRKVLTSYQSSIEEEQNQQLLVRLVLSFFQAQTLDRQAQQNMETLLEEDSQAPTKSPAAASKRKLKKDRRLKRQELAGSDPSAWGVAWDEDQAQHPTPVVRGARGIPIIVTVNFLPAAALSISRL